jgi:crotonobetainyl-CoA:carnitine CoA-transferase CaiB-like acyl-CoA transferase
VDAGSHPTPPASGMTLQATYTGLRVLDLSTNIAGPFAAMILGDLGADVIKVERPPLGDDTRSHPTFPS